MKRRLWLENESGSDNRGAGAGSSSVSIVMISRGKLWKNRKEIRLNVGVAPEKDWELSRHFLMEPYKKSIFVNL